MDLGTVTRTFFNQAAVTNTLDAGTRKALAKFGAYVRRRAKSSIRYKDQPSDPGQPPTAHRRMVFRKKTTRKGVTKFQPASPLRELIYFGYDPAAKSVVIGPVRFGTKTNDGTPVPRTLEEGGHATAFGKTIAIRPRPYMRPAFEVELTQVGGDFRNIVR